jgi:hypothetical protein
MNTSINQMILPWEVIIIDCENGTKRRYTVLKILPLNIGLGSTYSYLQALNGQAECNNNL